MFVIIFYNITAQDNTALENPNFVCVVYISKIFATSSAISDQNLSKSSVVAWQIQKQVLSLIVVIKIISITALSKQKKFKILKQPMLPHSFVPVISKN